MAQKKQSKIVPMMGHNDKLDQFEQVLANKDRELRDATYTVGSLTIKNQRQEVAINNLLERLSKYEDIETGEPVVNDA